MSKNPNSATDVDTGAKQFPLVHKLIELVDLQRYYSLMRDALKAANRKSGAYKGWVTRWKNKYINSELANEKLQIEIKQLGHDKKVLSDEIRDIAQKLQRLGPTLLKLKRFEDAVKELRDSKYSADDQVQSQGYWTTNTMLDMQSAVNNFLESVDEIMDENPSKPGNPEDQ